MTEDDDVPALPNVEAVQRTFPRGLAEICWHEAQVFKTLKIVHENTEWKVQVRLSLVITPETHLR
jgi:hypothetical protein